MGILILFRKNNMNPFKKFLHGIISLKGEKLIITSGFISECKSFSPFQEMEPHLRSGINNGLTEIVTVAGRFFYKTNRYRKFYGDFVKRLRNLSRRVKVNPFVTNNWHAKVSIKIFNGKPIAAIIGSSNLTSTAYGSGRGFNKECDVVIWNERYVDSDIFRNISNDLDRASFIFVDSRLYKEDLEEEGRLKKLYDEISEDSDRLEKI